MSGEPIALFPEHEPAPVFPTEAAIRALVAALSAVEDGGVVSLAITIKHVDSDETTEVFK